MLLYYSGNIPEVVHHHTAVDIEEGTETASAHWAVVQNACVAALVVGPHIDPEKVMVVYHTHRADFAFCQPQGFHMHFRAGHQTHQLFLLLNCPVPYAD